MNLEETIFEHALELPSAQARAEYLRAACADDQAMLERLQGLLRAHDRAGKFLEHDPSEVNAPASAIRAAACGIDENKEPVLIQKAGERIGPYKLLEKIGEGGFGEVWMAEQKEPVKRRVALKIIKLGMDTRAVIARFEAERQALAMMDHPNIAKVLDAGATDNGRPYFVMELVRGVHLTEYCGKNRLSVSERIELFMQVCRAIQHAHQKGVIHRDIKPSNILVTLHDGVPVPKVIDFGIAKATQQELTEKTVFTQFRHFIGTPAYISPEQAEMSGLEMDTRSDIYSLGVLLYELLTGTTPFDSKELILSGLDGMRKIIQQREPMRPSTRLRRTATRAFTSSPSRATDELSLSTDLDWIVMKCLEKDRARRYETANGLANDLQRHLDNEPVVARPPSTSYRLRKFVRRNRVIFSAGVAVAVVLVLGVVASTWQAFRATQLQKQAQAGEYAAKMGLAQAAWEQGQIVRVRQLLEETADNPDKGFEWYYWQRQTHLDLKTLRGHLRWVDAVAFSPDGLRIVTGSADHTAKVWDAISGEELMALTNHLEAVTSVAYSPDGRRIVTGSLDSTARVWDAITGAELLVLKGHSSDVWGVAYSPDGRRIATCSTDRTAIIWDAATGRPILPLKGHQADVASVTFSPDGQRIATASDDHTARVWDATTGREITRFTNHSDMVFGVRFSQDGQRIVTGSSDHTARVWDVFTGLELLKLEGHTGKVYSVAYSADGRHIATVSQDQTARIWDAGTGKEIKVLKGHNDEIWGLDFSPDGKRIVTGSLDQSAKIWNTVEDQEPLTLRGHREEVRYAAFSADGERLVTSSCDNTAKVWETATGRELMTLIGHSGWVPDAAFSPDGHWIATASLDETVKLWDPASGRERFTLSGHHGGIWALAFSPDSRRIVTGSVDKTAKVWDIGRRTNILTLVGHSDGVQSVAFSSDGQRIGTSSFDDTAKIWDATTGRNLVTLRDFGALAGITAVRFSPDVRQILTASSESRIKLWDYSSFKGRPPFQGHSSDIRDAAFSPDGRRIVTGSKDQTAKLWDAVTGAELLTFKGHSSEVMGVRFSPDGRRIATASDDHTVKIWQAASAQEVAVWRQQDKQASERVAASVRQRDAASRNELTLRAQDPGAIQKWLVRGPLLFTNDSGEAALNDEQISNEAQLRPQPGAWRPVQVYDGLLDIDVINHIHAKRSIVYAVCYILSDSNHGSLSIKVGSDDEARIYLNEKEIYRRTAPRTYVRDQDEATNVTLAAGLNTLVLKEVTDLSENLAWRCSVRFADASGRPVKGIHTTITPASDEDPGAIGRWLVLAPIPCPGATHAEALQALDREQLPHEADLRPNAGDTVKKGGAGLVWTAVQQDDYLLDFNQMLQGATDYKVAYAVSYILSDTNRAGLRMQVGSDDEAKIYLNGKRVYRTELVRACLPDEEVVEGVEFKAGLNVLVFKVVNELLGWQGSIRFTDANNQPVKGIRVTLTPPL